MERFIW